MTVAAATAALTATLGIAGAAGIADASTGHAAPHARVLVPRGITLHPVTIRKNGKPAVTVPWRKVKNHVGPLGSGNLLYQGGPVQGDPELYLLFWGNWWSSTCPSQQGNGSADENYLYNYYHGMGSVYDNISPIASQYGDSSGTFPGFPTAAGQAFITWNVACSDPPQSATDAQLAAEAASYASFLAGEGYTIDNNTQIVVVSPSGTNPGGGFGSQYCAYHNWTQMSNGTLLSWTNLPYIPDAGGNCGANFVQNGFDGWSIVGGHEYMESVTDPFLNAWYDASGEEIGDKCAWTNLFTQTLGPWGTVAQQPEWDNSTSSCRPVDTITVSNPGNQTTNAGTAVSLQINGSSSESNPLAFSASGLPNGLHINSAGLITGTPTTAGTSTVTVTATDTTPSVTGSATFTWTVKSTVHSGPIKNVLAGKCLDDSHAGTANGNDVQLYTCNGTLAQKWTAAAGNTLTVLGKCLDNHNSANVNGNEIDIWTCNGTGAQKWVHQSNGSYLNPATGKCLDDFHSGTANGNEIDLYKCNGTAAQKWTGP
ncbi:MAG TPA: ricin-type beta-trefoil lectin domain protein [Streptosporangiaceae bacterium]|nr:ricin-type beta-trefoil lectin domain protein [Streptosporangiaceae bacterium]